MPGFLEQGKVDHRGGVAHRAGVAVPVPGAAHVAATLDDPNVLDAGLLQAGAGHEAGKSAADDRHRDLVAERFTLDPLHIGVVEEMSKAPCGLDVLLVAVLAQALVPLGTVLEPQGLVVDGLGRCAGHDPPLFPVAAG